MTNIILQSIIEYIKSQLIWLINSPYILMEYKGLVGILGLITIFCLYKTIGNKNEKVKRKTNTRNKKIKV